MSLCKVTTGVRRRGGDAPWRRVRFRIPAGGGYLVTRYRRRLGTLPINYPALVERLIANLLDNAVRYNVPGGRVEISTRVEGDKAIVSIANTGPVIPPEQVHRLFDPFQRLDRTRVDDRHGLGPSIVRASAVAHDATRTANRGRRAQGAG
jgi:signal transduction histidine kinase